MEIIYHVADPAGNTTALVATPVAANLRGPIARSIMDQASPPIEQVGFMESATDCDGSLQMMGGEFCGNAARSFGLFLARQRPDLAGRDEIRIRISGVDSILRVSVDRVAGEARIAMPPIHAMGLQATAAGGAIPLVRMEGISHALVFAPPDAALADQLLAELAGTLDEEAIGVMFYEPGRSFVTPLVWVKTTATTIWESSCGSGSVSLAAWLHQTSPAPWTITFQEPGGVLKVHHDGSGELCLSGPVSFTGPMTIQYDQQ